MPTDLDFAPLRRERTPSTIEVVRELGAADLELLKANRGTKPRPLERIRERHHAVARLIASGLKNTEVSAITGMSAERISILKSDPAFRQLVHDYTVVENGAFGEFTERATILSLSAMNELQDRLEESPESISESMLLEMVKATADRIGHAPVSKSVNLNASVDLGSRMSSARARLAARQREALTITAIEDVK